MLDTILLTFDQFKPYCRANICGYCLLRIGRGEERNACYSGECPVMLLHRAAQPAEVQPPQATNSAMAKLCPHYIRYK